MRRSTDFQIQAALCLASDGTLASLHFCEVNRHSTGQWQEGRGPVGGEFYKFDWRGTTKLLEKGFGEREGCVHAASCHFPFRRPRSFLLLIGRSLGAKDFAGDFF